MQKLRERKTENKATRLTSFKPRIADSFALIEEEWRIKKKWRGLAAEGLAGREAPTD